MTKITTLHTGDVLDIKEERSEFRENISDFFDENYPEDIKEQVYEKTLKGKSKDVEHDIGFIGGEISQGYAHFLKHGKLVSKEYKTDIYSPLDIYSIHGVSHGGDSIQDMIALKKMYLNSYVGIFKCLGYHGDLALVIRNIISGETIHLYTSNDRFELDEHILGRVVLQEVENYKGYNFACGNIRCIPSNAIQAMVGDFYDHLPSVSKMYYSSQENREDAYRKLSETTEVFEKCFGENPTPVYTRSELKKGLDKFYNAMGITVESKKAGSSVLNHPMVKDIGDLAHGLNLAHNKQGMYIFSDYLSMSENIGEFYEMKSKKGRMSLLPHFIAYVLQCPAPVEAFLSYEDKHPKGIQKLLQLYREYYGIDFHDWETFIQFWHSDYPDGTPLTMFTPDRIGKYLFKREKLGRNSDCLCGSDKKFKKCCGLY